MLSVPVVIPMLSKGAEESFVVLVFRAGDMRGPSDATPWW